MTDYPTPESRAPARRGDTATWAPGSKDAVGTSLGTSRVWFTVANGIVTEVLPPSAEIFLKSRT